METSGLLKIRASSITSAVPDPSSLAASPQPMPSMCAPRMYICSGCLDPIFVQYTSSRGPSVEGCVLSSRSFTSGCFIGSLFTVSGKTLPRRRDPPGPNVRFTAGRPGPAGLACGVAAVNV